MKKLILGAMLLALASAMPLSANAGVSVSIGISLPPPIVVAAPPEVILLPSTGVYVAPDLAIDLFFFDGWWWRPWEGHWYRSRNYRSGWAYYDGAPSFYERVPPRWREDYRAHRWHGREWDYHRISHQQLQQIWQRNYREQSRRPSQARSQQARPQRYQADRPHSQGREPHREDNRPREARPQQSRPPHGGPEGRR
jgi:hypothetical protein